MSRQFVKEFLLNKSVKNFPYEPDKGDLLSMFDNLYEVISTRGGKQTLLKDNKNLTFAIPTNKLKLLLKNEHARRMYKSTNGEQVSTVAPLYTVHNNRMKVQMDPPKWVDVNEGRSYDAADSEHSHHDLHHEADLANAEKFHRTIATRAHQDDHDKLRKLVTKFIGSQRSFRNLRDVHRGMSKNGLKSNILDRAFELNKQVTESWKHFSTAYKTSVKRAKSKGK